MHGDQNYYKGAQWVKLSESWPKFKFFDPDETLKNLREGQKKVPRIKKM
jgi:hypothetical protein